MNPWHAAFTVTLAFIVAYAVSSWEVQKLNPDGPKITANESAYERIMRTRTIRCGYVLYDPYIRRDANTREFSGIFYDVMNEIAKRQNLRIEWAEEVGWGTYIESMKRARFDLLCSGGWQSALEGQYVAFSNPVYMSGLGIFVRAEDNRFNNNLAALNSPDVVATGSDGSLDLIIARTDFPQARQRFLPNLTDASQILREVANGKADFSIQDVYRGNAFMAANPGEIKNLVAARPVRRFPTGFILPLESDWRLKSMLDSALAELHNAGYIESVLQKYEALTGSNTFYRVE